jgi:hypothetical protein
MENNDLKTLKIALLISGRINNNMVIFKNTMENLIKNYDVDIFVSHSKNIHEKCINDFIDMYKPKKIIESDEIFYDLTQFAKHTGTNRYNCSAMFLNRKKVFGLLDTYIKENNIYYDIVISFRNDLFLNEEFNILKYLDYIKSNHILIPEGNDYGGLNDQLAFGNYYVMKIYFSLYDSIIEILNKGILLHPETLLKYYLCHLNNKKIYRFKFSYYIYR